MTTLAIGQIITIRLKENPTTGYSWSLSTTPGLQIISDKYISPNTDSIIPLLGSGGIHEWTIRAISIGPQVIYGVYKQPWELYTGNENHYSLLVRVIQ